MRLNKYLALCGVGSRRKVEDYIFSGRVLCDGYQVLEPAFQVSEGTIVTVDDVEVYPQEPVYLAINKPRGYVCAVTDSDYPVVLDLLPKSYAPYRLFPVGRLDLQSEGLLLLTNDGDFAQRLIHPRAGITKEYEVRMDRPVSRADLAQLRQGALWEGRRLIPSEVEVLTYREPIGRWLRFVLHEGVKREIRIIAEAVGLRVEVLFRRKIGRLELRKLRSGWILEFSAEELWHMIRFGGVI